MKRRASRRGVPTKRQGLDTSKRQGIFSLAVRFINDDPTLVELGKESLEALGYRVVAKTGSVEALEVFRAQPERFALVITDQTMPDMTGMVLARRLREVRPGIPIILGTGYSEQVTKDGAAESGIREVMMKPVVMGDLARSVRKILDGQV